MSRIKMAKTYKNTKIHIYEQKFQYQTNETTQFQYINKIISLHLYIQNITLHNLYIWSKTDRISTDQSKSPKTIANKYSTKEVSVDKLIIHPQNFAF